MPSNLNTICKNNKTKHSRNWIRTEFALGQTWRRLDTRVDTGGAWRGRGGRFWSRSWWRWGRWCCRGVGGHTRTGGDTRTLLVQQNLGPRMCDATTAKQNIKSSDYISLKVKWIKNAATQLLLTVILTCALCIIKRANRIHHIALLIILAARVLHRARGGWK